MNLTPAPGVDEPTCVTLKAILSPDTNVVVEKPPGVITDVFCEKEGLEV